MGDSQIDDHLARPGYRTPEHRREAVREARDALLGSRHAILTTHLNADGDGVGSEVALAAWMHALGGRAWIVNPTAFPEMFRFLLPAAGWVLDAGSAEAREACGQADLAVVLDAGEMPRIGRVKTMIQGVPTVVVDHHQPGDQPIGGVSLRDPGACATGELVHDLVLAANGPWPAATLNGIYVAILTDTGSFRFSNATPDAHRIVADLIARGADAEDLCRRVYGGQPARRLRLLARALATLEVDPEAGVAWMRVPEDVEGRAPTPEDVEGIVDYPRSVAGVEVGLLFRRAASGGTKISFRANGSVDVNALAREFGGGGHVKASGALVELPPDEVIPRVVEATRRAAGATRGRRNVTDESGPGVPGALPSTLRMLGERLGVAEIDRLWIFPRLVRGRRESGLVALSLYAGVGGRRRLLSAAYRAEQTGRGVTVAHDVHEHGEALPDRLPRVMDGVARRAEDRTGEPREVVVEGADEAYEELMREFMAESVPSADGR